MKILDIITKYLALAAAWVLGILLIFGISMQPITFYQTMAVCFAVICVYLGIKAFGGRSDAEN